MAKDNTQHPALLFISKAINRIGLGETYHYQCDATDSAANQLSYQAIDLPAWLTFDSVRHILSGKAARPGQYLIKLLATNLKDTAKQFFMLTVYDKQTVNILCLGNSITNGTGKYNSYRRDLWKLLNASRYNFDLIGSWDKHHMGGAVPDPDFDMDHEGHSGWTAADIFNPPSWDSSRGNITQWLKAYTPDIVLAELGTNDVFQCRKTEDIIKDFTKLVEQLRSAKKDIKIFIAQILPLGEQWAPKKLCDSSYTYAQAITELNNAITVFTKKYTTGLSPVIVVDQFSGVEPEGDMYDDIHPNAAGERKMAERWFSAIKQYLYKLN